jgi:hypothetical protein
MKYIVYAGWQMVMFPLNNNEDVEMAEGGSHWTLLVYIRLAIAQL